MGGGRGGGVGALLVEVVEVGGAVWIFDGATGVVTGFCVGTVVVEEGVAGVGAGAPGPPGPSGTPTLLLESCGLKLGSELRTVSLRSA